MKIMTNKQKYLNSVRFCLESMLYITQVDSKYDLYKDLVYYYNTIVVPDNIITKKRIYRSMQKGRIEIKIEE